MIYIAHDDPATVRQENDGRIPVKALENGEVVGIQNAYISETGDGKGFSVGGKSS